MKVLHFIFSIVLIFSFFSGSKLKAQQMQPGLMKISSPAFGPDQLIPVQYTCDGENFSPPLSWSGAPENVKSFVLICEDPDAPGGNWIHWIMYNIPPYFADLPGKIPPKKNFDKGLTQGLNDFNNIGYGGPCPPKGIHHYIFSIYALDFETKLEPGLNKNEVMQQISSHIIAKGEFAGKYGK